MQILKVRKLADRTDGERLVRFDPATGARKLVNPAAPGDDHEPWPLLGVQVEGEAPEVCRVPASFVQLGVVEGWIEREGERVVHRAGGPTEDPWRVTHTFIQCDAVVLHLVDGDLRYLVTHQPDKYADETRDERYSHEAHAPDGSVVDWFYELTLEG